MPNENNMHGISFAFVADVPAFSLSTFNFRGRLKCTAERSGPTDEYKNGVTLLSIEQSRNSARALFGRYVMGKTDDICRSISNAKENVPFNHSARSLWIFHQN